MLTDVYQILASYIDSQLMLASYIINKEYDYCFKVTTIDSYIAIGMTIYVHLAIKIAISA